MDREDRVLTYVGLIIAIILGFLGVIFTINPSFLEPYTQTIVWILFISMFLTIVAIIGLFIKNRETPITDDSIFRHVAIYYTHADFQDDQYYLYNPKYIANRKTSKVYFMPNDYIVRFVRTKQITSHKAYSSEKTLKADLLERGYTFIPSEATFRKLDIFSCISGRLIPFENVVDDSILAMLKEAKEKGNLSEYELIFIFPWHQRTKTAESKNFPPSKRLLLNNQTKIARPPPQGDLWLYIDHILNFEVRRKHFPYEKLKWWPFFEHYKFVGKRYDVSELVNKCTNSEGMKESDYYSPIHAMIVRVNNEVPRETALKMTVGAWVNTSLSLIDVGNVSEVFNKYATRFTKEDLEMWIGIEKEIKTQNGFFLGQDRQKWFDTLEAKYLLKKPVDSA